MKKLMIFLFAFTIMLASTSCGSNEENSITTTIIEAKACYENAGYVEFVADAEKTAEYTFTAENSESAEWMVYVLDQSFDEGYRYIAQFTDPVLTGDGTITVNAGQFVYIYCSVNEFTYESADENAKLNVTIK